MNSERKAFEEEYCKVQMIDNKGDIFDKDLNGNYVRQSLHLAWLMWQSSAQRQGYKLVPVEMAWKKADEIACKHWNDYAKSHEIQNQGQSATANSIELARLVWCKNKAHQIMSVYKAMIGTVDD